MRIHFERSGGFTGMIVKTSIDTEQILPEEAQPLLESIHATRFFELPERITAGKEGADQFQYQITVEEGGKKHTVILSEAGAPDELRPVLHQMTLLARKYRG